MENSICLNMIVKNEAHIIIYTLTKLLLKIKIDYYIICDTGSTDNTVSLIETFFKEKIIPGCIYNNIWKDFGYNRSLALNYAKKSPSDYIFIFDADDEIIGNFVLPELTKDAYMVQFGNNSSAYERMCLVKNGILWEYIGVLHEYIKTEQDIKKGNISGDYYIVSGRLGARNKIPPKEKYLQDAEILEKGYHESFNEKSGLFNRYAYYCANSYRDAGEDTKAIEWYLKTLKCNGWFEERYNSCTSLFELYSKNNQSELGYYYLVKSYTFNPKRVEGIYLLIQHYTCEGNYEIAFNYYQLIQNYFENEEINLSEKLFAKTDVYNFYLPYYMIIVCEKLKKYNTGIKMYLIIFKKMKEFCPGIWWTNNLIYNLQFYKTDNSFKIEFEKYIIHNKINFKIKKDKINGILFYTGFSKELWNLTYSESNALGGSERAVIELAKELSKYYPIVIAGDVLEEKIKINDKNTIVFIHRFNLKECFFKIIIVSRYVSFFTIFPNYSCEKLILMAHDTHFMNNLIGCPKTPEEIIKEIPIDYIVCLTEWHKNEYIKLYPQHKIILINNGIKKIKNVSIKIPNTFIYTSGSIRGLERLLELWPQILEVLPDSTLNISSYEDFPKDDFDHKLNIFQKGIKHHGKLNQNQLYALMGLSEYWLYPCCFDETSCITAMEMMGHNVICMYYPRAGLTDTMGGNGIQINYNNEIETLLTIGPLKNELIKKAKEYSESCSWENRAKSWLKLIKTMVFYATPHFAPEPLTEYITSLKTEFNIIFTTDLTGIEFDELVFVYEVTEAVLKTDLVTGKTISYLNTEPLNISSRLNYIKEIQRFNFTNIYDYSLSNIKIMNNHGIKNTVFLEYRFNLPEVKKLKEIKANTVEIYDFGIICSPGLLTNSVDNLTPPRRKEVVVYLLSQGFSVNIISGWGETRDLEIAKCKYLLNIHGEYKLEPSNIFEHLRCNRLLYSGYNILSETCEYLDPDFKFSNLTFKNFSDFFKITLKNWLK
jgi:glycosyltransferase involved in cell wall biosynthesis